MCLAVYSSPSYQHPVIKSLTMRNSHCIGMTVTELYLHIQVLCSVWVWSGFMWLRIVLWYNLCEYSNERMRNSSLAE